MPRAARRWPRSRRSCSRWRRRRGESVIASANSRHTSLRGALATKQSRIPQRRDSGLLRCARNDGVEAVARGGLSRECLAGTAPDPAWIQVFCPTEQAISGRPKILQAIQPHVYCAWGCFRLLSLVTVTLRCSPLRRASKGDGPAAPARPSILRG